MHRQPSWIVVERGAARGSRRSWVRLLGGTLLVSLLIAAAPFLQLAWATDPPPPAVSDRMTALASTGFTRAAVAPPVAQATPDGFITAPDQNWGNPILASAPKVCNPMGAMFPKLLTFTPPPGGPTGAMAPQRTKPYTTADPLVLRDGAVVEQVVDLHVPGPISDWGQVRSYNSRVQGSGTLDGKWLNVNADYRLRRVGMFVLDLIVDATSKRSFVDSTPAGDALLKFSGEPFSAADVVTNWTTGAVDIFHSVINNSPHPGKLKEKTTLAWRKAGKEGMLYSYNASHQVTQITTGEGQDYNIVFSYAGSRITKIEVRTGAETSTRVRQVEYTYCDRQIHSADVGVDGDLVQATVSELKSGGNVDNADDWIVRIMQYRYGSNGLLKAVFDSDAVEWLIAGRGDINTAADILTKGDDDNDGGAESHRIKEYASRRFTYYATDVKTDNSGAGTEQDPKCVTVWAPAGEDLQSKYGGTDADEVDAATDKYLVQSETVGACAGCGGGGGSVTRQYYYLQLDHGTPDPNEVVWLVVEDTLDANNQGVERRVYGMSDGARLLREVTITDPVGAPTFSCRSWKLDTDTGVKLNLLNESRAPADHNVTSSTVDEFLNPSHNGSFANDAATLNATSGATQVLEFNANGDCTGQLVRQGSSGTAYYVTATDYLEGTSENRKHLVTATYVFPQAETSRTAATRIATTYAYTFWTDSDVVQTRTTTLPAVVADEQQFPA